MTIHINRFKTPAMTEFGERRFGLWSNGFGWNNFQVRIGPWLWIVEILK